MQERCQERWRKNQEMGRRVSESIRVNTGLRGCDMGSTGQTAKTLCLQCRLVRSSRTTDAQLRNSAELRVTSGANLVGRTWLGSKDCHPTLALEKTFSGTLAIIHCSRSRNARTACASRSSTPNENEQCIAPTMASNHREWFVIRFTSIFNLTPTGQCICFTNSFDG